jgi:hypothetical protein
MLLRNDFSIWLARLSTASSRRSGLLPTGYFNERFSRFRKRYRNKYTTALSKHTVKVPPLMMMLPMQPSHMINRSRACEYFSTGRKRILVPMASCSRWPTWNGMISACQRYVYGLRKKPGGTITAGTVSAAVCVVLVHGCALFRLFRRAVGQQKAPGTSYPPCPGHTAGRTE